MLAAAGRKIVVGSPRSSEASRMCGRQWYGETGRVPGSGRLERPEGLGVLLFSAGYRSTDRALIGPMIEPPIIEVGAPRRLEP